MDFGKEFEKFAVKDQGINSNYYNKIVSSMMPQGMTPNIIEERQMNAVAMDVFSRLMMDRIIFMGTAINEQVANIIQAQLLATQKSGWKTLRRKSSTLPIWWKGSSANLHGPKAQQLEKHCLGTQF